jgi:eukaryotic-like serine/threonine-protein kinase
MAKDEPNRDRTQYTGPPELDSTLDEELNATVDEGSEPLAARRTASDVDSVLRATSGAADDGLSTVHGQGLSGGLPPDALIDQVLANRYRILKKIGEGGMGSVYLAEHIAIEKKIAIKVLLHEYARKQDLKERFLQEARAAARIGHENIVDITDFGSTPNGSVFFAMEFMDGRDLSHVIRDDGALKWDRAKPILAQICRALGAAHSKEIIHRDMKPENIYLIHREGNNDFVKVLDFGIAKVSGMSDGERRLTRTGMIFGTPEYMSPEQAQGHRPDHRIDIYATGVIMYEMLTGDVPFKADTFMGILTKHIFEQPLPPSEVCPDAAIPADVEDIVMKALAKDKEERYGSMAEMGAAIAQATGRVTRATGDRGAAQRIIQRTDGLEQQLSAPLQEINSTPLEVSRGRGGLLTAVIVLLLIGGAGVGGWFLWQRQNAGVTGNVDAQLAVAVPADAAVAPTPDVAKVVVVVPDAAPAVVVELVGVRLESSPRGAEIRAGEKVLGVTPTTLQLPKGKVLMLQFVKDGYRVERVPLEVGKDKKVRRSLRRRRVASSKRQNGKRLSAAMQKALSRIKNKNPDGTKPPPGKKPPATKAVKPPTKKKDPNIGTRVPDLRDPFGDKSK